MKLDIMGLQFDNVTMDEASARAEQILAGKKTCYAVTPNAEIAYERCTTKRSARSSTAPISSCRTAQALCSRRSFSKRR